ncbi:LuxR family transcriptional regulator [Arthrobacter sp. SPG23]|uniref:helix-turn-helix transcriptional regulator n=1 Tax=Arthrobacter sp. SPG23 TaxID=1610703 RepID=UPI0005BBA737|nr:response regulator transcription factor [Arthrobacter sp. SPG23]KIS26730.1 LuxR family transcriptional regulator [Arthrobacter sp. SPG23]
MATSEAGLDQGRSAFEEHRWTDAFEHLSDADQGGGLPAPDLERLATAEILTGKSDAGIDTLTRAHEEYLVVGDVVGAARCAGWIGIHLMNSGQLARSTGWFARAGRLVAELDAPCAVQGMLLIPTALGMLFGGDPEGGRRVFMDALAIGEKFQDRDLISLSMLGTGQACVALGDISTGVGLFDEVMVAVTAGELSPVPSGIIYCAVIGTCHLAFDLRRALEWTVALDRWCGGRPDMVLFSGQCQSHRADLYRLHGAWDEAISAAKDAQRLSSAGDYQALYGGYYQQGEVERLRGEFAAAEECYRQAARSGYEPQPGLALLKLARGDIPAAQTLIRGAADAADLATRRHLLPALVEIELAAGDTAAARQAADELASLAQVCGMPMAQAASCQAGGAVLLAEGEPARALPLLRRAWTLWRELGVPFEAARSCTMVGQACRAAGDDDSAEMDFEAAHAEFLALGAAPAAAWAASLQHAPAQEGHAGPLTPREVEVLRLVAAGKSNRVIAGELYLSEKTIARHISNIFLKLGLQSRVAATRYAVDHGLTA